MYGNPAAERAAIEMLYDALCSIGRPSVEKRNNIATASYSVISENNPCGLSDVRDNSAQKDADMISDEKELFIAPETDIRAGDLVTVTLIHGSDQQFKVVGVPMVYATHQQVRLVRRDIA